MCEGETGLPAGHFGWGARITVAEVVVAHLLGRACRIRWKDMPPRAGVTGVQWQGFIDPRKAKRETLTPRVYELLSGRLAKHADAEWPPGRIIDTVVHRGWLSFERAWLDRITGQENGTAARQNRSGSGNRSSSSPGTGRTVAAATRVLNRMASRRAEGHDDGGADHG
jgi:hypothetical protein